MQAPHPFARKVILAACLMTACWISSASAACDQPTLYLQSQAQVNSFKTVYGCDVFPGRLVIWGVDITNLDSLHLLREIGDLEIRQNDLLTDLEGLTSLQTIRNGLYLGWNPALSSLHGLENLESIGTNLSFENNYALATLQGLDGLRTIGGRLWLSGNDLLLSLNGLNLVDTIGEILIDENEMLQTLTGLDNLVRAGSIRIEQNTSLYSLTGLGNLESVPGGIIIFANFGLVNLGNLEKLEHIGKKLWISYSPLLESLDGLNVHSISGGDPADIYDGLLISNTKATNLNGLENLQFVDGRLYIGFNPNLKTLDAFDNLQYCNGELRIEDNVALESIDAIADLQYINGGLEITDNILLSTCSIESVCRYLDAPVGTVYVWGNGPGCTTKAEIQSNCSPITAFNLIDANLEIDDSLNTTGDIRLLSPAELVSLTEERAAVATDGISTVLVRMAVGPTGSIDIDDFKEDGIEFPWGDSTYLFDGINYLFMLYTPPEEYLPLGESFFYGDGIKAYNQTFPFDYYTSSDVRQNHFTITHVRPPVVLMHGTYSNPDQTWKTSVMGGSSLYDRLTQEGYKTFTVNYKETNGTTGFITDNTGFQDNAKVLWGDVYPQNTGGIKEALTYYRDQLGIAVTQADVVGHSLGGVLPRVYASSHYNPDYKRAENFMEGDINRLITLGSTHFGSHLGELQLFLDGISPFNIGALDWLAVQGVNLCSSWVGGASPSKAVMDQLPPLHGTGLQLIGRTEIPSHAITLEVPQGSLKDTLYDPDESYYDLYWYITTLMYQVRDVRTAYLDAKYELIGQGLQATQTINGGLPADLYAVYNNTMLYKSMVEDAIHRAGIVTSILDGTFKIPSNQEIFKYALGETSMSDFADPLIDIFVAGADPVGVAAEYFLDIDLPSPQSILLDQLKVREETIEGLRSLIFNHDKNDGVVRVQSQSGELEKECPGCVTHFENVLHGFAPRYPDVQNRIIELLDGNMAPFAENGFPPVDHAQLLYYPPESLDLFKVSTSGGEAICQSGIVPGHARVFAQIADENNAIFIMRPVNPDGTDLIAQQAATKGMDVKPKSSNWGPQKGYLPVQQRYSKIWKVYEGPKRDEVIHKYDSLAQKNIVDGITVGRHLIAKACNGSFHVYIDQAKITGPDDAKAEDEVVLVPVNDPDKVCYWGENFSSDEFITDCEDMGAQHQLVPLLVMASPEVPEDDGVTPRFLTADYDMLMTGFYRGMNQGAPMPPTIPFRPKVGQITAEQEVLVEKLNQAAATAGYRGGNVVHHGPENQFNYSPYIDYPLTVFAPDNIPNGLFNTSTNGLILSIEMGPPGFRDINLKQFINRMRREGYDLYQNQVAPGWRWKWNDTAEAFELEDAKDLGDYVEQLPKNVCDKIGGELKPPCPGLDGPDDNKNAPPKEDDNNRSFPGLVTFRIEPSLVYDENISIMSSIENKTGFTWMVLDPFGNIFAKGKVAGNNQFDTILLETSGFPAGVYTFITSEYGQAGRFVKM